MTAELPHRVVDECVEVERIKKVLAIGLDLFSGIVVPHRQAVDALFQVIRVEIAIRTERNPDRTNGWAEVPFLSKIVGPVKRRIQFSGCRAIAALRTRFAHLSSSTSLGKSVSRNESAGGVSA